MEFEYVLYRFRLTKSEKVGVFDTFYTATEYADRHFILDYVIETKRRAV